MRSDARRNRERVLAAAGELLAGRGPAVSLDEIAHRAGVGPGTLHRHFPTKEALVSAVIVDSLRATVEFGRASLDAPDPGPALTGMLERMLAVGRTDAPLKAVLAAEGFDLRSAAPVEAADLWDVLDALLRRAQRAGSVRGDLDVVDVMALVAGTYAAMGQADGDGKAERSARLFSVLLHGLRP